MLLKGFVGTGILFMGKAFFNGGIVFSTIVLLAIAMISLWSFLLLTKTYLVVPGSFGDIGGALYGNYMRLTILASIAFSQIGFVAGECGPLRVLHSRADVPSLHHLHRREHAGVRVGGDRLQDIHRDALSHLCPVDHLHASRHDPQPRQAFGDGPRG
jgi:hypothetical protein